jgi:hypothetical protein
MFLKRFAKKIPAYNRSGPWSNVKDCKQIKNIRDILLKTSGGNITEMLMRVLNEEEV